ncbi:hypothetical protein FJO69_00910 [[Mycoplasma] falconis]|uniref:Variable surface lipoprotein n=1 Tax=[Mycoplasma] falconis TaxID=92403 RepID=A0A501XBK8_9BACT|nr:hypothetical protein [[Mycoplasma] falconis]TPE57743.1 hypothetical protein FJO69_00910 [[Mycoplasma] falconis]
MKLKNIAFSLIPVSLIATPLVAVSCNNDKPSNNPSSTFDPSKLKSQLSSTQLKYIKDGLYLSATASAIKKYDQSSDKKDYVKNTLFTSIPKEFTSTKIDPNGSNWKEADEVLKYKSFTDNFMLEIPDMSFCRGTHKLLITFYYDENTNTIKLYYLVQCLTRVGYEQMDFIVYNPEE